MEQFMDFLMQRAAQQQAPAPQTQQQKAVIDKNYERVRKQRANVFQGTTDPAEAEEWLQNTERETVLRSKDRPITLTWNDFLREFAEKYTPEIYRDRKKLEFLQLKQNDMSVTEYEVQFVRLCKYALEEIATEELKRKKFEMVLRLHIRDILENVGDLDQ
ncbi:uncharacterized protein LOC125369876 [Ricinus communis]|uniref:uncharacterized protein LOC125369876 n=1 Tax=Ricinus communis TaxID=3988 RepID=UPI00201A30C0|nr:uncharacterized protein LOC125369876 [Ricinus communis]